MTQYLQSGLKDFKNILHTYSLWYKDVLRQFWFQSEKIIFFFKILLYNKNETNKDSDVRLEPRKKPAPPKKKKTTKSNKNQNRIVKEETPTGLGDHIPAFLIK